MVKMIIFIFLLQVASDFCHRHRWDEIFLKLKKVGDGDRKLISTLHFVVVVNVFVLTSLSLNTHLYCA